MLRCRNEGDKEFGKSFKDARQSPALIHTRSFEKGQPNDRGRDREHT